MTDFDTVINRRPTNSIKWKLYGEDVLPLWVADMDFAAPEPVQEALRRAVEHGIFGYEFPTKELRETVAARMEKLYGWQVSPEMVVATPGVIAGFTAAARTVCTAGQGILVQPPVYPPFLSVHKNAALVRQDAPLRMTAEGAILHYRVDLNVFERAVNSGGAQTGMFLLCNPHNPTGQAYSRDDLVRMAEICQRNNIFICSDEIHSELLLGGPSAPAQGAVRHIPIASLDPEIANRTITLIAPSKTFNIPGLFCGFAILTNQELLKRYKETVEQMAMHVSSLGLTAAQAAFSGACDDWLAALRVYLTGNRDFLVEYVKREFNGIRVTVPQATYLAWLDCNELVRSGRINGTPHEFFLKQAKVALNEGNEFGFGGEGFVRLNFGCPRKTLEDALERLKAALA
ncbi:MAG: PatB family C-S lyase [Anaerolineales bacterium]|nr:PatB family C-S lyase [Anaerolineales bacterium]